MKKILYPGLLGEMARHGDTQKSLAKILGVTYASVCRRITGKKEWTISEIEKLCEYYGKDYYELFKNKD